MRCLGFLCYLIEVIFFLNNVHLLLFLDSYLIWGVISLSHGSLKVILETYGRGESSLSLLCPEVKVSNHPAFHRFCRRSLIKQATQPNLAIR
jgi:hypothetical protein